MATWEDVRRIALALPETTEHASRGGLPEWRVRRKRFAWKRPLRRSDLAVLGEAAPDGPILAASLPDLGAKEAFLADAAAGYFTTPHFDGYAVVLTQLAVISLDDLDELLVEAWLARAPKQLAAYLAERRQLGAGQVAQPGA